MKKLVIAFLLLLACGACVYFFVGRSPYSDEIVSKHVSIEDSALKQELTGLVTEIQKIVDRNDKNAFQNIFLIDPDLDDSEEQMDKSFEFIRSAGRLDDFAPNGFFYDSMAKSILYVQGALNDTELEFSFCKNKSGYALTGVRAL